MYNRIKLINIRGLNEINDPFYRYQMEAVSITYQGIKVAFLNINNICDSLGRDPNHLIKFLKRHFGSSFEYKNNVAYTTKNLTKNELQNSIYHFIENFVLCKGCANPETKYFQSKKSDYMICSACSHKTEIK